MSFVSLCDLEQRRFEGFISIAQLRASLLRDVPAPDGGVYVVARQAATEPRFRETSPAGPNRGRNPTICVAALEEKWVRGTCVLYFGKANGGIRSSLRDRIKTYLRHGAGRRATHWGGRAIWQLEDAEDLQVGWRIEKRGRAPDSEDDLLDQFHRSYNRLPFANLRR